MSVYTVEIDKENGVAIIRGAVHLYNGKELNPKYIGNRLLERYGFEGAKNDTKNLLDFVNRSQRNKIERPLGMFIFLVKEDGKWGRGLNQWPAVDPPEDLKESPQKVRKRGPPSGRTREEDLAHRREVAMARTHCKYGHEFTPKNTYIYGHTKYCRKCKAERWRKYYAENHDELNAKIRERKAAHGE